MNVKKGTLMSTVNRGAESATVATVVAVLGVLAIVGATVIGVLIAVPESKNPAQVVTVVLGFFGTTIPVLLTVLLGKNANQKLDRVLNGEMDAKIESAVHRVLDAREPITAVVTEEP